MYPVWNQWGAGVPMNPMQMAPQQQMWMQQQWQNQQAAFNAMQTQAQGQPPLPQQSAQPPPPQPQEAPPPLPPGEDPKPPPPPDDAAPPVPATGQPPEEKPPLPPDPHPEETVPTSGAQWQQNQQKQWQANQNIAKNAPPALKAGWDTICTEEVEFQKQYNDWKKQYDDWKDQNKNHPNQEQFKQYEGTWKQYEVQMDEKRGDIMRRKTHLQQEIERSSAPPPNAAPPTSGYSGMENSPNSQFNQPPPGFGQDQSRFRGPGPNQGQRFSGPRTGQGQNRFDGPNQGQNRFSGPQGQDSDSNVQALNQGPGQNRMSGPGQNRFNRPQGPGQNRFERPQGPGQNRFERPQGPGQNRLSSPQGPGQNRFERPQGPGQNRFERPQGPGQNRFERPQGPGQNRFDRPQGPGQNRFERPPGPGQNRFQGPGQTRFQGPPNDQQDDTGDDFDFDAFEGSFSQRGVQNKMPGASPKGDNLSDKKSVSDSPVPKSPRDSKDTTPKKPDEKEPTPDRKLNDQDTKPEPPKSSGPVSLFDIKFDNADSIAKRLNDKSDDKDDTKDGGDDNDAAELKNDDMDIDDNDSNSGGSELSNSRGGGRGGFNRGRGRGEAPPPRGGRGGGRGGIQPLMGGDQEEDNDQGPGMGRGRGEFRGRGRGDFDGGRGRGRGGFPDRGGYMGGRQFQQEHEDEQDIQDDQFQGQDPGFRGRGRGDFRGRGRGDFDRGRGTFRGRGGHMGGQFQQEEEDMQDHFEEDIPQDQDPGFGIRGRGMGDFRGRGRGDFDRGRGNFHGRGGHMGGQFQQEEEDMQDDFEEEIPQFGAPVRGRGRGDFRGGRGGEFGARGRGRGDFHGRGGFQGQGGPPFYPEDDEEEFEDDQFGGPMRGRGRGDFRGRGRDDFSDMRGRGRGEFSDMRGRGRGDFSDIRGRGRGDLLGRGRGMRGGFQGAYTDEYEHDFEDDPYGDRPDEFGYDHPAGRGGRGAFMGRGRGNFDDIRGRGRGIMGDIRGRGRGDMFGGRGGGRVGFDPEMDQYGYEEPPREGEESQDYQQDDLNMQQGDSEENSQDKPATSGPSLPAGLDLSKLPKLDFSEEQMALMRNTLQTVNRPAVQQPKLDFSDEQMAMLRDTLQNVNQLNAMKSGDTGQSPDGPDRAGESYDQYDDRGYPIQPDYYDGGRDNGYNDPYGNQRDRYGGGYYERTERERLAEEKRQIEEERRRLEEERRRMEEDRIRDEQLMKERAQQRVIDEEKALVEKLLKERQIAREKAAVMQQQQAEEKRLQQAQGIRQPPKGPPAGGALGLVPYGEEEEVDDMPGPPGQNQRGPQPPQPPRDDPQAEIEFLERQLMEKFQRADGTGPPAPGGPSSRGPGGFNDPIDREAMIDKLADQLARADRFGRGFGGFDILRMRDPLLSRDPLFDPLLGLPPLGRDRPPFDRPDRGGPAQVIDYGHGQDDRPSDRPDRDYREDRGWPPRDEQETRSNVSMERDRRDMPASYRDDWDTHSQRSGRDRERSPYSRDRSMPGNRGRSPPGRERSPGGRPRSPFGRDARDPYGPDRRRPPSPFGGRRSRSPGRGRSPFSRRSPPGRGRSPPGRGRSPPGRGRSPPGRRRSPDRGRSPPYRARSPYGGRGRRDSRERDRDRRYERDVDRDRMRDRRERSRSRERDRFNRDRYRIDRRPEEERRPVQKDPFGRDVPREAFKDGRKPSSAPSRTEPAYREETVINDDILCNPGRRARPARMVVLIRGLPGSGKTYVSKLLKEKEVANGGVPPRMMCMDDYFMVETEKELVDPNGKKSRKTVLEYEYDEAMEDTYKQSFLKSFKKQIDNLYFNFIIVDAVFEEASYLEEFWSYAKTRGFQVYVAEVQADASTCAKRNTHNRSLKEILKIHNSWQRCPQHILRLDIRSMLQDAAIEDVEMEEAIVIEDDGPSNKEIEEDEDDIGALLKSKWDIDVSVAKLDKLDGFKLKKHSQMNSMEDYLQLPDDYATRTSTSGQKRVRWADIEERKHQEQMRNVGFVVGQTDWNRMTDDNYAQKALNRTKYI